MKKIRFMLLSALLAIGMSFYSNAQEKPVANYFWFDVVWHVIPLSNPPCPIGSAAFCYYFIDGGNQQMYYSPNFWDPVYKKL